MLLQAFEKMLTFTPLSYWEKCKCKLYWDTFSSIRLAKIQLFSNTSWRSSWKYILFCLDGMPNDKLFQETLWQYWYNCTHLPFDPAIPLLGIYPKHPLANGWNEKWWMYIIHYSVFQWGNDLINYGTPTQWNTPHLLRQTKNEQTPWTHLERSPRYIVGFSFYYCFIRYNVDFRLTQS